MDTPILRVELQRGPMDCGIAVMAMLLGKSYEETLMAAASIVPDVLTKGITWKHMRVIAKKLGYRTKVKQASRVSATDDVGALSVGCDAWKTNHLVVLKEGIVVETDGCIWDVDVYLTANGIKAQSLMTFEPL